MHSNRSPIDLRPRLINSQEVNGAVNLKKSIKKVDTSKPKMANQTKGVETKKLSDAFKEISEIKIMIEEQRKSFNESINQIRNEIDEKSQRFDSIVISLKSEIGYIKRAVGAEIYYVLQPNWKNTDLNDKINYLITSNCIEQIENEFESQINSMRVQIDKMETKNKVIEDILFGIIETNSTNKQLTKISSNEADNDDDECECEYDLFDVHICKIHPKNDNDNFDKEPTNKKIMGNIEFIIASLQEQIDALTSQCAVFDAELSTHINVPNVLNKTKNKTKKQTQETVDNNKQNSKINDGITKQNKIPSKVNNLDKQEPTKRKPMHSIKNKQRNLISLRKKSENRFVVPYDPLSYSKFVRIEIHDTQIHNLDLFQNEFIEQFESYLGNGTTSSLTINSYRMHNGYITSIIITVNFNVPINYKYIDDFNLPANWNFFPWGIKNKPKPKMTKKKPSRPTNSAMKRNWLKYV